MNDIGTIRTAQRVLDGVLEAPDVDLDRLLLWNSFPKIALQKDEVEVWQALERGGLLPHVAPGQASPVLGEGRFQLSTQRVAEFRALKYFTEENMRELASPDPNVAQTAGQILAREAFDLRRRALQTQEFLAWEMACYGSVDYRVFQKDIPIHLKGSIPIITATVGASNAWDLTAGKSSATNVTPVDDIDAYILEYRVLTGKDPEYILMTSETYKRLRNSQQVSTKLSTLLRVSSFADAIPSSVQIAEAFGWPPIRLYDETYFLQYTLTNAESAGSDVVVELGGDQAVLAVGDKVYIGDGTGDGFVESQTYTEAVVVSAVDPGTSITVTLANSYAAGTNLVCRKTYMADERIVFGRGENIGGGYFGEAPYGIESDGNPSNMRGLTMQSFMVGGEPNLGAAWRVWIRDFPIFPLARQIMSVRVRFKAIAGVY